MSVPPGSKITKQDRRRERREEQLRKAAAQRRATRVRLTIIGGIVGVIIVAAITFFVILANRGSSGTTAAKPAAPAIPASTPTTTGAQSSLAPAVDNVLCNSTEQLIYHIHAHLSIYINSKMVPVSQYIGITNTCIYWLHTHDTSGVIHIESPTQKTYLLGNFLDLWQQQFSQLQYPTQLDQSTGWQAYVDGKPYTGSFRTIPLYAHTLITLAYKSPGIKPDTVYNWGNL